MPSHQAMTPKERMRRHRARRKAGRMVIPVEIGWDELDTLQARGLLSEDESDPAEIAKAVQADILR